MRRAYETIRQMDDDVANELKECVEAHPEIQGEVEGLLGASRKRSIHHSIRAVIREASAELQAAAKECLEGKPHVKAAAAAALAANEGAAEAYPQLAALVNSKRSGKIHMPQLYCTVLEE